MCFPTSAQSVETRDLLLRYPDDRQVFTVVEKQPEFPGGYNALQEYLRKNIRYPAEAQKANVTGRVFASFIVRKDGQITDVSLLKGLGFGCDEEAVRVIEAMPRWTPGSQSGAVLNVKYNLAILFGVPYPKAKKISRIIRLTSKEPNVVEWRPATTGCPASPPVEVFQPIPMPPETDQTETRTDSPGENGCIIYDMQPEFPGGRKSLMRYLTENTRYPKAAKQAGITGRVFASFVIDTAGYVSQP